MTVTEIVVTQLFSNNASKRKIKMETQNTMGLSNHLRVISTKNKGVSFFSCLAHGV